jgi:3-oxoacyl-(acyl-carrier-protein) synthase
MRLPLPPTRSEPSRLTEQAAAIIIESRKPAGGRGAAALTPMRVLGVRTAGEAYHIIKSPPDAEVRNRLARWACKLGSIDLMHPHATGTIENDESELDTLAKALGSKAESTPVYAAKGAIGHGLGAAGLASVVIASLIARCGRVPPMPWLTRPVATPLRLSKTGSRANLARHAIFASGFGGHTAATVIEADGT